MKMIPEEFKMLDMEPEDVRLYLNTVYKDANQVETPAAVIKEFENSTHYAGEEVERTLQALRPWLLYRQQIARHQYTEDLTEQTLRHCNEEMSKILCL